MADEGDQMHMEHESNAGKWILIILAVLVVAAFGYAHYTTHEQLGVLTADLSKSQKQVEELSNRMRDSESSRMNPASLARFEW